MHAPVVPRQEARKIRAVASFEPRPEALPAVRAFVGDRALAIGASASSAAKLVVVAHELSENAIRHARTPFEVRVSRMDRLVQIEVEDGDPRLPAVESRVLGDEAGDRGLHRV
jgi:anti-sigma regulatory factor (Ser/Thr protein kinase)